MDDQRSIWLLAMLDSSPATEVWRLWNNWTSVHGGGGEKPDSMNELGPAELVDSWSWCCLWNWVSLCLTVSFFIYWGIGALPEKAMAPHSSTLAWKIPWMEEPGRLWSMGSLRVGHDWVTSLSLFTWMHWRRKWQPTPVFLPGEPQGQGSLVGCRPLGRTESDMTEAT